VSKQTVTGVAEGHLLHKDFLVEYDPDERTWTVEREVPAEPTPEPGTAGTATVRGVEGVRVMRVVDAFTNDAWASPYLIDGELLHAPEFVTDFVPDPKPGVIPDDVANAIAANWQARLDDAKRALVEVGKFVAEIDTDILHDGSYTEILRAEFRALGAAYDEATDRAIVAERDTRAEHAEVERLRKSRNFANQRALTAEAVANRVREENDAFQHDLTNLRSGLMEILGDYTTSDVNMLAQVRLLHEAPEPAQPGVSTPAVTTPGTETPAETPAPVAFVLPEEGAFLTALTYGDAAIVAHLRTIFGQEGHEQTDTVEELLVQASPGRAARVRALLAEHAVTPERLAPVLHDVLWSGQTAHQRSWDEIAAEVHAALTRKAAS
jgi:hypothetical protein